MPHDRIPLLYIAPWVDLGGSDKGTIDWFKHLDRERYCASLITTQPSSNRWLHQIEPYAEEIWNLPDLVPGSQFPAFILGFIESRGIQIVHIMNSRLAFDLMPDMTCVRQPPAIVVQFHAEEPQRDGYVRYVSTRYGNLVDAFSVTSEQLKRALIDYDVAPSRIHVIYTGVDAAGEFDPSQVAPFDDLDGDGVRILWPGRLAAQKDPHLTLDVIAALRDRGLKFTTHIVGDGPMLPEVRQRARELGLDTHIRWHPPSLSMPRWYRSCDLLLMTSVFEGVPYVIYEALAMEVPVVAPALPGNVEFMDPDNGALIEPRDAVFKYVEELAALIEDPELRRHKGERSRARMLEAYGLRETVARHEELYATLLQRRDVAARARDVLEGAATVRAAEAAGQPAPERLTLPRTPPPERSVGVLVPCYRHGIFLGECIDSLRAQTLQPAQVVIIDDGSTDPETVDALDGLEGDPFVQVIRLGRNEGPSAARNRGLRELRTSYVLPVDADDRLLPHALERMVAQLEAAPADVGFVYPNAQHFGNRHDYVPSPAYNLHLLMRGNYCPATSLFDRRVFEAGVAYAEEVVFGHEDWDLVLQLGERGVQGIPAIGPTFLYRRRGFSRVNAVEYGPASFDELIRRRHARLYAAQAEIKARWAPALSILLAHEPNDAGWADSALNHQTCGDFEVIAAPGTAPGLADAITSAAGRWLLVMTPEAGSLLSHPNFVESFLTVMWASDAGGGVAVAGDVTAQLTFARITDPHEIRGARPIAVGWARDAVGQALAAELGLTDSLVGDLVVALQAAGPLQWRSSGASGPRATASIAAAQAGALL